MTAVYPNTQTH